MKLKALRTMIGHRRGEVFTTTAARGKQLVDKGLAIVVEEKASRPSDGPTGGEKSRSSSQAAPARKRQTSRSREDDAASSSSTTLGSSRHGQTSSTPATSRGGDDMEKGSGSEG